MSNYTRWHIVAYRIIELAVWKQWKTEKTNCTAAEVTVSKLRFCPLIDVGSTLIKKNPNIDGLNSNLILMVDTMIQSRRGVRMWT